MTWRPAKNTEEEDEMAVKRSELANIPTKDLQKQYKADCAQYRILHDRTRVYRAELVARQDVADAEAKLAAAKAALAASETAEKEAK